MNIKFQEEELLPYLRDRFGKRLRPEVSSVMMVQTENGVYLEYSLNSNPGKVNKVD